MPVEIRVPQMGESVTEATILRWLKKEGETVAAGEAVAELETDKVNVEIPADTGGVLLQIAHQEGDTVAVGDVLATIGDAVGAPVAAALAATPAPTAARNGEGASAPAASPLARTLAEDNQIDLSLVTGTGSSGRITKEDVANFIERSADAPETANVLAAQTAERAHERAIEYDTPLPANLPRPLLGLPLLPPLRLPPRPRAVPKSASACPAAGRPSRLVWSKRSTPRRCSPLSMRLT